LHLTSPGSSILKFSLSMRTSLKFPFEGYRSIISYPKCLGLGWFVFQILFLDFGESACTWDILGMKHIWAWSAFMFHIWFIHIAGR
jgi:hypothetical protein